MRYWLVMPAAGSGRRFGESVPKQYAPLAGRTVIEWALSPFLADSRCTAIVVALAPGDPYWPQVAERLGPTISIAEGGKERCHSVRKALQTLAGRAAADDWVLVHDAARPCLSNHDVDKLLERLASHPVGGLLAAPVSDTLKHVTSDGSVDQTIDRAGVWRALTPQMFRYGRLCEALVRASGAGRYPTDEAQALEWAGARAALVEGSAMNMKITTAADLLLAEAVLRAQSVSAG